MSVLKVYNATKGKWEFVDTVSTGIIPSSVPLVDPKHDQLWLDTSSNDFQGSAINAKLDGIVDDLNLVEEKQAFKGALLKKTITQTLATQTPTTVTWDDNFYDTDNLFSENGFLIPEGISKVKLQLGIGFNSAILGDLAGGRLEIVMRKNGAFFPGLHYFRLDNSNNLMRFALPPTAVISVSQGDYFDVTIRQDRGTDVNIDSIYTWFFIEVIG